MKKLIISMVATASIALVAKADVAPRNATSFENYDGNFSVNNPDSDGAAGQFYWSGGGIAGNEGVFEIKALGEGGLSTKGDVARPKYWANQTGDDLKALAIDTDEALARHVATKGEDPQEIGTGLYFDSMVQFTATTEVPSVTPGDKLIVWLKETEIEGEDSTYALWVTAGVWVEGGVQRKEFPITNITGIGQDEWHRLTIAANMSKNNIPTFTVYVDGEVATSTVEGKTVSGFQSMAYEQDYEDWNQITSVSFQGKGAIDDLVWTNEDPFVAPTKSYTVIVDDSIGSLITSVQYKIGDAEEVSGTLNFDPDDPDDVTGEFALVTPVDAKSVTFFLNLGEDYEVVGGTFVNDRWVVTVPLPEEAGSQITLKIIEKPVAQIGDNTYDTLGAAIAAAVNGDTITLLDNIKTDFAFVIKNKAVTIDLKCYTVETTENDKSGDGVFWVQQGGVLTIGGNGTVNGVGDNRWNIAVFADGGTVIINGGTYTNVDAKGPDMTHFDLIYAKNGGKVEINGGTFICATPKWTLNSHDSLTGTFEVKGGMFKGYDPSNMETENGLTSWCPADYEAKPNGDYYEVAKKTTEALKPGASATVTATTEAEALAKVELSVTVPEGVDATKYTGYFTLKATDNGDGTWAVAAVLKDEVKPVIEATKDDEGNVTPAIFFGADGKVTINISNELPGLFYGVKYATTVGGVKGAKAIKGLTVTPAEGATAGFFSVEVDFTDKNFETPAAAAQQN